VTNWLPIPEPVTWTLPSPISHNGVNYGTITLRAPTGENLLKAMAIPGASSVDVTHRLVEAVSGEQIPYDAVKKLPWWMIEQMSDYMNSFTGAPLPGPLEARRAALMAAAEAEAAGATAAS
jgi:hypothetical protein